MAGRARITREKILGVAVSMVRASGWSEVTARSLADQLDCSTMPLYSAIGSMDSLRTLVQEEAVRLLGTYQSRPWSANGLLDMAVGYIAFAREERNLFHFLFDAIGDEVVTDDRFREQVAANQTLAQMAALKSLSQEQGQALAFHSWIYVHGLATLVAGGVLCPTDQELLSWVELAGGAFWAATRT